MEVEMSTTQHRGRRLAVPVSLGVGALLALTACTPGEAPASGEIELTDRAPVGTAPVESVTWNLPQGEPTSLDPRSAPTISAAGVVSNLCDPLLSVDSDYNLGPNLVSFEVVTDTQIVYTVEADATFWDGTPVTAEDIAFSLQRAAAPESVVSFLYTKVASIEATSETEVTVDFLTPDVLFNSEMATFAGMVVQKAYAETAGADFGTSSGGLMCSGPYELVEWTPGSEITITRNDDYWNPEITPLVKDVTFTFIADATAATQALTAGEIDGSYQITPAAIPALKGSDSGQLYYGQSMESVAMYIVNGAGPLGDLKLRTALQNLIDREALAEVVFQGAAEPLFTSLTPRTWPNDQADVYQEAYDEIAAARAYDLDRARELIDESSYDGEELVLGLQAGDETMSQIAQLIQQQAEAAGVTLSILEVQPLEFAEAGYDPVTRERLGLDLTLGSSFNVAHDPLEPLGFTLDPYSPYNYLGLDDPRINELLASAFATFDEDARAEMVVEMQDIAEEFSAAVPLVSTYTVTYLNDRLGGAVTSFAYLNLPSMAYLGGVE